MTHAQRIERFDASDLYVVITEEFCAGRSSLEILDAVLDAGVTLVQLREKEWEDDQLLERAREFRARTSAAGALLIIDDRIDIALAVQADGVHLGQHDLPTTIARKLAPELLIGVSTHNLEQAHAAVQAGASCINIGPIFATQTKQKTAAPLGPGIVADIAREISVPFSCMGGIKPENIAQVLEQGARHPAVVTAVTAQEDVRQAASALREMIQNFATA